MSKKKRELKQAAAKNAAAATDVAYGGVEDIVSKIRELIDGAGKTVGPYAQQARKNSARFASRRVDAWEPHIRNALDKVTPAVDAARGKVNDDLLPHLQRILHEAAENPYVAEGSKRGKAAVQALKGEVKPKKKGGFFATAGKILLIGTLAAGAVAAIRHFLTPKDDGWTAHDPSRAYVNNTSGFASATGTPSTAAKAPNDGVEIQRDDDDVQVVVEEEEPVSEEPVAANPGTHLGEGSFVGENPPAGYTIKGNERSKKYHVPGGSGYERTIAEVWFNSEEAAQAAGFSKAQR